MKRSAPCVAIMCLALVFSISACVAEPTVTPGHHTPTAYAPSPADTPPATSPIVTEPTPTGQEPLSYQTIKIEEIGLTFEVPDGWQRVDSEWSWAPPGRGAQDIQELLIGVHWASLAPPQEAEAVLLPGPSQIIDSAPIDVGWGSGRSFQLEVYESTPAGEGTKPAIASFETHVLIVVTSNGGRLGFDFYARAQDLEQLSDIEPFLWHMLDSSILEE